MSFSYYNDPSRIPLRHKYSDKEYESTRNTIGSLMKSIITFLTTKTHKPIKIHIINICFKTMFESVKYLFNNHWDRTYQLFDTNFHDAYTHVLEELNQFGFDDGILGQLQEKMQSIYNLYNTQNIYLKELEKRKKDDK